MVALGPSPGAHPAGYTTSPSTSRPSVPFQRNTSVAPTAKSSACSLCAVRARCADTAPPAGRGIDAAKSSSGRSGSSKVYATRARSSEKEKPE